MQARVAESSGCTGKFCCQPCPKPEGCRSNHSFKSKLQSEAQASDREGRSLTAFVDQVFYPDVSKPASLAASSPLPQGLYLFLLRMEPSHMLKPANRLIVFRDD